MIFLHVSCGDLNSNLGENNFSPEIDQTLSEPYTVGARERSSSVSIGFAGLPGAKDKITKEKKTCFYTPWFLRENGRRGKFEPVGSARGQTARTQ